MALTSSSTYTNAIDQLNNNLGWEGSPTKATAYLEAVRWLRANRASFSSRQNSQINWQSLDQDYTDAKKYVDAVGATALARRTSFAKARPRT